MTSDNSLHEKVEKCILKVIKDFKRNPELFLSESDLKCRLFMELNKDGDFSREEKTGDGKRQTNYVHSEISYFLFGKLNKRRVDICIVKPSNFDFDNKPIVERKGCSFMEPSIGIELKLNKNETKSTVIKKLKDVLESIKLLKNTRPDSKFYVMQLDKKNLFSSEEISELQNNYPEIKIIYADLITL